MVAVAAVLPAPVDTVKVPVVLPPATVTAAGTIAATLLLDSAMEIPALGAAALNVTVPARETPRVTLAGLRDTDKRAAEGVRVSAAFLPTLL
jgi:hypothetical protein